MFHFIVLLLVSTSCIALEIDSYSGDLPVARRGEEVELFCESSTPYQWCYWAHGEEEYRTIIGDESLISPLSFEWVKSNTKCGLKITSLEDEHAGNWKCHLADTDEEEVDSIRDERFIEVFVAQHATVSISVPDELLITQGEEVEVGCVVEEEGNPPPVVTLFHEGRDEERQNLGDGTPVTFSPQIEDTGSAFYCHWEQIGPDGELFFEDKVHSDPLEVIMVPVVLENTKVVFEFEDELEIPVQFMAKPWPQEGDIIWSLTSENQTAVEIEHKMDQGHFQVEDIREVGENDYELQSILHVYELYENITVSVEIVNSAGSTFHQFEVFVPPPPPTIPTIPPTTLPPTTEPITTTEPPTSIPPILQAGQYKQETTKSSMGIGAILGLVGGLLFGILLLCLSFVLFKKKSTPVKVDGGSKRNSGYFPSEAGSKRSSGFFTSEKQTPLLISEPVIMRQNSGRRSKGQMTTFGKARPGSNPDIENSVKMYLGDTKTPNSNQKQRQEEFQRRPDIQFSYASFSSDDTDDLSTLGVPVGQKEFVDPLSAWNDLEPELDIRRSRNLDEMNSGSVLRLSLPPGTDISLTGPTGYPVILPSPGHSPTSTLSKLHYHIPEARQDRQERTRSGEWRARTPTSI